MAFFSSEGQRPENPQSPGSLDGTRHDLGDWEINVVGDAVILYQTRWKIPPGEFPSALDEMASIAKSFFPTKEPGKTRQGEEAVSC